MLAILVVVVIVSGAALAIMVVVKVRASRIRRTVASPYGMLVGPTDAELRRTREVHAENLPIIIVTDRKCLWCGALNYFDEDSEAFVAICRRCGRRHKLY